MAQNFEEAARWFKLAAESRDSAYATNPAGMNTDALDSTANAGQYDANGPSVVDEGEESEEAETVEEGMTEIDRRTTVVVHPGLFAGHWPRWCDPILWPGNVYIPWRCRVGVYWRSVHPWLFVRYNPWPHPRRRWGRNVTVVDRRPGNVRRGARHPRGIRQHPVRVDRPFRNLSVDSSNKGKGPNSRFDPPRQNGRQKPDRTVRKQPDRSTSPREDRAKLLNPLSNRGKQISNSNRIPKRNRQDSNVNANSGRTRQDTARVNRTSDQNDRQKPRSTPRVGRQPRSTPKVRQQPRSTPNVRKSGRTSSSGRKSSSPGPSVSTGRSKRKK